MKWVALVLFIAAVPALLGWLRQNSRLAPRAWALMGFLPFVLELWNLNVAPISWALWPGYVKGIEITLLDAVALAVYLSRPRLRAPLPFRSLFIFYIFASLLAVAFADIPQAAFFYSWQLARVFLLFAAVASVCMDDRGPPAIILGMVIGLCMQAGFTIQASLSGATQASGTFGHQNLLGMITHFVAFPALALFLVNGKRRAPLFGVASGVIIAVLGASRATIGLSGIGYISLLVLSIARKSSPRKTAIAGIGLAALAAVAPLASSSLASRFEAAPISGDYDERAAFEKAARLIIADHPMGIGANQYVVRANTGGYSERAGVVWNSGSRSANVHNVYLLVTAETGYLGLVAFVCLLMGPMIVAFRSAWANRGDKRGDLMLGLGVSLAIVSIHCFYEWVFMTYQIQYLFAIVVGMIAGVVRQTRASKLRKIVPTTNVRGDSTIAPVS